MLLQPLARGRTRWTSCQPHVSLSRPLDHRRPLILQQRQQGRTTTDLDRVNADEMIISHRAVCFTLISRLVQILSHLHSGPWTSPRRSSLAN